MNYRHSFHAGNFADVLKHVALTAILLHLKRKPARFAVIDTHAGAGLYNLKEGDAARTKEAEAGIGRLGGVTNGPPALLEYLRTVRGLGDALYPGSPLLAARLKRPEDRLVAIEKHPEEERALARALRPFPKARAVAADGYAELASLLPPPERRGLVLIDPPYERETEFSDVAAALTRAFRRFSTGIYLIWFPVKSGSYAEALSGELIASGVTRLLRIDLNTAPGASAGDDSLRACGLLVINPPFGFSEEMRAALDVVAPLLGGDPGAPAASALTVLASA